MKKGIEEAFRCVKSLNDKYQTNIIWSTDERQEIKFQHITVPVSNQTVIPI